MATFHYDNTETKHHRGRRTVRKVRVRGNKGYKSVSHFVGGKRSGTISHKLRSDEVSQIQAGKFIPGLFSDCKLCSSVVNASRKLARRTVSIGRM